MSLKSSGTPGRLILGYGVAVVSVTAAIIALSVMEARWQGSAPVSLFLMAVIVSTLVGGIKPGLLATALSILGFDYFVLRVGGSFANQPVHAVQILSLAIAAAYVIWLTATERGAVESVRRAHDELRRSNDALRAENAESTRAKEAVSESQQLLQQVLATLPVGVSVVDREGDIILANAVMKRIWNDPPIVRGSERWAQSVGSWHDSSRRIAPEEWASVRALSNGETSLNELIDIETYDGQPRTIQNSAAPIRRGDGQIVGAVIVNEDVTERVRAEKALQESATRLQRLSHRLLTVQEEERRHLSRELHDEFGQLLATITLHLHAVKGAAGARAQANLDESIALLQQAGAQVRSLALELRPTMLETGGLESALRWLAEQHQQRTGIVTEVVGHVTEVSGDLAIACFRVVQEALTNVVRHARARHVWIELSQREGFVELVVRDDGVGFDVTRTLERAASGGNLGLLGMRERVEILGGRLEIDSRVGEGTRICIALPLTEASPAMARDTAA
jgi:signal transduction histidine kinase